MSPSLSVANFVFCAWMADIMLHSKKAQGLFYKQVKSSDLSEFNRSRCWSAACDDLLQPFLSLSISSCHSGHKPMHKRSQALPKCLHNVLLVPESSCDEGTCLQKVYSFLQISLLYPCPIKTTHFLKRFFKIQCKKY